MNGEYNWCENKRITDDIIAINEVTNRLDYIFIIEGNDKTIVIDTGRGFCDLRGFLDYSYGNSYFVVLTHTHWDHIGSGYQFETVRAHKEEINSDKSVTVDGLSEQFSDRPQQFVQNLHNQGVELPPRVSPDSYEIPPIEAVKGIEFDTRIEVGDRDIRILHLPGHSPGHIGLLDSRNSILFGGDIIHRNRNIYAHFDNSDLSKYIDSLDKVDLLIRNGEISKILTAHNSPIENEGLNYISDTRDKLDQIRSGESTYKEIKTTWGVACEHKFQGSRILTKHPE